MSKPASILIINDDESIRKVLTNVLEERGYVIDTAINGEEAIQKAHDNLCNLALIDIRLPVIQGTELLTKLRSTAPEMVKIILTGYPSQENAIEAINKGADGYILKSVNIDVLHNTIKEYLKKQEKARWYSEEKVAEFIETRAKELSPAPSLC